MPSAGVAHSHLNEFEERKRSHKQVHCTLNRQQGTYEGFLTGPPTVLRVRGVKPITGDNIPHPEQNVVDS